MAEIDIYDAMLAPPFRFPIRILRIRLLVWVYIIMMIPFTILWKMMSAKGKGV